MELMQRDREKKDFHEGCSCPGFDVMAITSVVFFNSPVREKNVTCLLKQNSLYLLISASIGPSFICSYLACIDVYLCYQGYLYQCWQGRSGSTCNNIENYTFNI